MKNILSVILAVIVLAAAVLPGEDPVYAAEAAGGAALLMEDRTPEGVIGGGGSAGHVDVPAMEAKKGRGRKSGAGSGAAFDGKIASAYYDVDITQSGSTVTVRGTIRAPYTFYGLFVDADLVSPVTGSSVNQTINMNQFATGYHTVFLGVIEIGGTTMLDLIGRKYMVSNTITDKPGYRGRFVVYAKKFTFYPYNMAMSNQSGSLYMEYKASGAKKWKRTGYMKANMIKLYVDQAYSITGLKPKKTYKTRLRYGTVVTYSTDYGGDGKSYFFGGPTLKSTTIRTGSSQKPAVQSITMQAVDVKYHQVPHYGPYTGVYLYTEKFYTCKVKVTVRLKKKPGTKGIFLNGTWLKGNKTVYTKTFNPYPNYHFKHPRGNSKYTVTLCSGQNKSWGGYSPERTYTKRLS